MQILGTDNRAGVGVTSPMQSEAWHGTGYKKGEAKEAVRRTSSRMRYEGVYIPLRGQSVCTHTHTHPPGGDRWEPGAEA